MRWRVSAFDWNLPTTKREIRAATNKKLVLRLNAPSSFACSINGEHVQATYIKELVTDVIVRGDDEDFIIARCGNSQDQVGETGHGVAFNFVDYRGVLDRRFLKAADTLSYNNVDQGDIAWGMIQSVQARTNGNYGITQGAAGATGILRQWNPVQGAYVSKEIQSMSKMDSGFNWDIDASKILQIYYPQRGQSIGVGLEFGKSVQAFTRTRNMGAFFNDDVVTGGAGTVPVEASSSTIATDPMGRWDGTASFPSIVLQPTLNERALWVVDRGGLLTPGYVVRLKPGFWRGSTHIGLGDTVRLLVRKGRINDNLPLRVLEISVDIGDDGSEDVQLGLGGI